MAGLLAASLSVSAWSALRVARADCVTGLPQGACDGPNEEHAFPECLSLAFGAKLTERPRCRPPADKPHDKRDMTTSTQRVAPFWDDTFVAWDVVSPTLSTTILRQPVQPPPFRLDEVDRVAALRRERRPRHHPAHRLAHVAGTTLTVFELYQIVPRRQWDKGSAAAPIRRQQGAYAALH